MRLFRLRLAVLSLLVLITISGCSNRAATITGNERLARGQAGLGTTVVVAPPVDRDTYVTPGTAVYGGTLLVGRSATYEAQAFFKFLSYSLPDENLPGFTPGDVLFELPENRLRRTPISLPLDFGLTSAALADSGAIAWPGPSLGTPLASVTFDFTGKLLMSLGPGSYALYKQWATTPSSVPGFILRAPNPSGVAGFKGRSARFRVPYTWNNGGTIVADTINTTVPFDLYLHPPLSPAPTGADTTLLLGGGFETSVAVRAPVPAIPPGASVNDLRLVLSVLDSLPGVDGSILKNATDSSRVAIRLDVRQITGVWPEGVVDESALTKTTFPIRVILSVAVEPGDSLSIALPTSIARGWSENPATNQGVLITVSSAATNPGVVLGSRESSRPPVLRVGTTTAPPGRF